MGTLGDVLTAVAVFIYAQSPEPRFRGRRCTSSTSSSHIVGGAAAEGAFVLASVSLGFKSLVTWAAEFLIDNVFLLFGSYPLRLFGATTSWIFTWIVPVAFVAYIPAATLLGRAGGLHEERPSLGRAGRRVGVVRSLSTGSGCSSCGAIRVLAAKHARCSSLPTVGSRSRSVSAIGPRLVE